MEWNYAVGQEAHGPFPEDRMVQLIQSGEIRRGTPVWNPTLPGWIEARASTLASHFTVPPPMPTSGTSTAPPPLPQAPAQIAVSAPPPALPLPHVSPRTASDGYDEADARASGELQPPADQCVHYVSIDGATHGPYSLERIRGFAWTGVVAPDTPWWSPERTTWSSVSDISGVRFPTTPNRPQGKGRSCKRCGGWQVQTELGMKKGVAVALIWAGALLFVLGVGVVLIGAGVYGLVNRKRVWLCGDCGLQVPYVGRA